MTWRERLRGSYGGWFPGTEKAGVFGLGRARFFSGVGREGGCGCGSGSQGGGDRLGFGCIGCLTPNHSTCCIGAGVLSSVSFLGPHFV